MSVVHAGALQSCLRPPETHAHNPGRRSHARGWSNVLVVSLLVYESCPAEKRSALDVLAPFTIPHSPADITSCQRMVCMQRYVYNLHSTIITCMPNNRTVFARPSAEVWRFMKRCTSKTRGRSRSSSIRCWILTALSLTSTKKPKRAGSKRVLGCYVLCSLHARTFG